MNRPLLPASIRRPFANYSHGVEVQPDARLIFASGQLGIAPDDMIPATVEAQAELCFKAIAEILSEAAMGLEDIVRINAYVTAREHMKGYMAVRDRMVASPPPASTLMIVSGFTREEFLVEIEIVAAKQ
jgi:2-iminobutanoate/2-iminopropanoate deaminase